MKEYNIISNFYYKKKHYQLLLDNENRYYFIKINENNEFEYITLTGLIELTKKFSYNPDVLLYNTETNNDYQNNDNFNYNYNYGNSNNNYNYSNNTNYNNKKKKIKIIPKVIVGTLLVTISIPLLKFIDKEDKSSHYNKYRNTITSKNSTNIDEYESTTVHYNADKNTITTSENNINSNKEDTISDNSKTQEAIDRVLENIEKDKENFEVESVLEGLHLKVIYDNSKLEEVLGYKKEDISYNTIRNTINKNHNISAKYKKMYLLLANNLEKEYPSMDLRVWYENLKTIKIVECSEMEMKIKAVSASAYACYRRDENVIYTVKDYEYNEGTWEYQVIMHEMCHPIRSLNRKYGKEELKVQFANKSGNGTIIEESLNSLLAVRSYDKNERDIAYQLQSNMVEIMVDCLDNYTYQDFVEHNITYFENELNKQNQNDRAVNVLALIELQYTDYHNDDILVDQSQYYEIYDYISKMYYDKNINSNMTYSEALAIKNKLVDRVMFDVPEEYNIDTNHFTDYFNTYCNSMGITSSKTK